MGDDFIKSIVETYRPRLQKKRAEDAAALRKSDLLKSLETRRWLEVWHLIKRECDQFNKEIGHDELNCRVDAQTNSGTMTRAMDRAQLEGKYDANDHVGTFKCLKPPIEESFTAVVVNDDVGFSKNHKVTRRIRLEDESERDPEITAPEQIAKEVFEAFVSS